MRIMHWNIQSWRDDSQAANPDTIAEVISEADPRIVSLVEVDEAWGTPAILADIAQRSGFTWVFVPVIEFGHDGPAGGFGNALLTKAPVLAVQQWHLLWPPRMYDGSEPSEARAVLLVKVATVDGDLWLGSTHLPRSDDIARTHALGRLMALTETLDAPWVICGDFNTPAATWVPAGDGVHVSPDPPQATYPTREPVEPIDYLVAAPGLTLEARAVPTAGSDHLPVLAEVTAAHGGIGTAG